MIETLDFKLDRLAREARELATCVACYGVGESRSAPGRACETCDGRGRAAREPHVLELVALVRSRDAEIEELSRRAFEAEARSAAREELVEAASSTVGQLEQLAEARHAAEAEIEELRRQVDRLWSERSVREASVVEDRMELVELRALLSRVRKLLRDEEASHAKDVAFYRDETAASSARIEALDSELDEARQEIDRLRAERYRLRDELSRARRQETDE